MTELVMKMTFWLLAAMVLGFIVAWLLSRTIYSKRQNYEEDSLAAIVLERNNMIEKLEKKFRNEKIMLLKVSDDLKGAEKSLIAKNSLVSILQNKLNTIVNSETESSELNKRNKLLEIEIKKLNLIDTKRVDELEGFEEVLMLAEEKIEKQQQSIQKLEEELKIYVADSREAEFIISKDQFLKIEEQLERYQKEIGFLKRENSELLLKSQKDYNELKNEDSSLASQVFSESLKRSDNPSDDNSMVKVFKETYKKITNS